jgi:hypothetical protein
VDDRRSHKSLPSCSPTLAQSPPTLLEPHIVAIRLYTFADDFRYRQHKPGEACADIEQRAGGATAAEIARRAGHMDLADTLAARAAEVQMARILSALTEDGTSAGAAARFDSLRARLTALCESLDVVAPATDRGADDEGGELGDGLPMCSVCLCAPVDTALKESDARWFHVVVAIK